MRQELLVCLSSSLVYVYLSLSLHLFLSICFNTALALQGGVPQEIQERRI